jgi:murein DD-endopeptidase MepM/ murein hydrolase activator NlpD
MRRLAAALLGAIALLPVAGTTAAAPPPPGNGVGFELRESRVTPGHPLFDGERKIRLHYGFAAREAIDLEIRVVRVRSGNVVRAYNERGARPGERLKRVWNGLNRRGRAMPDGRYEFRVGPAGERDRFAASFKLHGHVFPVDGPHGTRGAIGEFHAPRSGGRIHEGFDVTGACGTPLLAARGGVVTKAGYDPVLYGNFVLIDAAKSDQDLFYAHMTSPSRAGRGERVKTGEVVGDIGQTGNAASTPCHLHFEIRVGGEPIDPEPALRRWDGYS